MTPHRLDWAAQPWLEKHYPDLPVINLSQVAEPDRVGLRDVLNGNIKTDSDRLPDISRISEALYLANGLTGRTRHGKDDFYFRSSPSAGALYPNELYLVCFHTSPEIQAGVYYADTGRKRLLQLRRGDFRACFPEADETTSALFVMTGIFFRSAWKYRKRAFRYLLLDGGHLMESTRLALAAAGRRGTLIYDFNDDRYNHLLGLDTDREVCLAAITIKGPGTAGDGLVPKIPDLPPAIAGASRVSSRETVYESINEAYRSGKTIIRPDEKRSKIGADDLGLSVNTRISTKPNTPGDDDPVQFAYAEAVVRRRSKRNFISRSVSEPQFRALLEMIQGAYLKPGQESPHASTSVQTGFLSWGVDNLEPGFYLLPPRTGDIECVRTTDLIPQMTAACLNQEWLKNAALHFLFLTNLKKIERESGARGYRHAMMTAGRLGHVIYLAATAMGLGCCGIGAFYDPEAEHLLGLNQDSTLLYLVAVGHPK